MHHVPDLAATVTGSIVGAFISIAFAVLVGGLTMAWRLGRLEQRVNDLRDYVYRRREKREDYP